MHQHFTLADNLSVVDNVILGSEPMWRLRSDRRGAANRLRELSRRFGLEVDPDALIGDLAVGERQRVEILKALYRSARRLRRSRRPFAAYPQALMQPYRRGERG